MQVGQWDKDQDPNSQNIQRNTAEHHIMLTCSNNGLKIKNKMLPHSNKDFKMHDFNVCFRIKKTNFQQYKRNVKIKYALFTTIIEEYRSTF